MSAILERLQADVAAALASVPALAPAHHIKQDEQDLESRVRTKIGTANPKSGKAGLVLLCLFPEIAEPEPNLPGPMVAVRLEIQTIEHVITNRGASGTGLRSSEAALAALKFLHQYHLGDAIIVARQNPVRAIADVADGFVSHAVTLFCKYQLNPESKVAEVEATIDGASDLTLTTSTSGAIIYYTTDGTYPDTSANQYSAPFAVTPGQVIRAAAHKSDLNPSDVIEITVSA